MKSQDWCGGVDFEPSGGNFVQTFSLGSKADDFKSRDMAGAGRATECLLHEFFLLTKSIYLKISKIWNIYNQDHCNSATPWNLHSNIKIDLFNSY